MKIIYLDCFSGISGDMTLAALVDAGADKDYIEQELAKIRIEPFTLSWRKVNKRGVSALKLDVLLDESQPPRNHRHYSEIVDLILRAGLSERATALALSIFEKIGIAEAKIHDIPLERVHFHEVGAMDSIADIVGVALAIDSLEAEKIICSPVPLGSGTVHIDHGLYPVPAPATLEMMRGIPIAESRLRFELTTPTGAAIVSGIAHEFKASLPSMIVDSIGYGAGTKDLADQPNVLRVVVGHTDPYLEKWHTHHELHQIESSLEHTHHHHHQHNEESAHAHGHKLRRTPALTQTRVHGHGHEHSHPQPYHNQSHTHSHRIAEPGGSTAESRHLSDEDSAHQSEPPKH